MFVHKKFGHNPNEKWDKLIQPNKNQRLPDFKEAWHYRELATIFFVRNFITFYKQTILGPIWYLIQPLLTTITFYFIFAKVASLSTDGVPPILFYMSGIILWGYFSHCFINNSQVFTANAQLFSKVYFPRIVVPISVAMSGAVALLIQFILLILMIVLYFFWGDYDYIPRTKFVFIPLLAIYVAILGVGVGLIVSAVTVRYRDLVFLSGFMAQLWMYATPVIYPLSQIPDSFHWFFHINPMSAPIETFRYFLYDVSSVSFPLWVSNVIVTSFILILGLFLFSKIESIAMDTV